MHAQDTLKLFSKNRPPREHQQRERNDYQRQYGNDEIRTIGGRGNSCGFYIGINSSYSEISGYDAITAGARLAWISNHGIAIGLAGNGFFSEPQPLLASSNKEFNYTGGYGGLLIEPILFPRMPVHLSFPVILGAGGIAEGVYYDMNYPYETTGGYVEEAEAFLIAEPGVELEINAARWIRFGLSCSYRFTTEIDNGNMPSNPLDGMTAGFSLKFGKF
jgi:hypothetical protein